MPPRPVALTIAGSDPSGGAGIQADLKTFHQFGVYGEAALTLLTVQNTTGVSAVHCLDPALVSAQIEAASSDIPPAAVKTGALGNATIIEAVAASLARLSSPLVLDPVMISKHGSPLLAPAAVDALRRHLIPRAFLLTPNVPEAAALAGLDLDAHATPASLREAVLRLSALGPANVLLKGGHLPGDPIDLLYHDGRFFEFPAARVPTSSTHGTGCSLSAALAALLARSFPLLDAVTAAKAWISRAIASHPALGHGAGPINHFAPTGL